MEGFQLLADFTGFLHRTGLRTSRIFVLFALEELNLNQNSALGRITVVSTPGEHVHFAQRWQLHNFVERT